MTDQPNSTPTSDDAGDMEAMSSAGSDGAYLFAVTGTGFGMNLDGRITVKGAAQTVLYFSDRPNRLVGSMATRDLVTRWDAGADTFAENPPNALLTLFEDDAVRNVVVILTEPDLSDGDLSFAVDVLAGRLAPSHGPVNLLIDSTRITELITGTDWHQRSATAKMLLGSNG
jgi:hypothetical protein